MQTPTTFADRAEAGRALGPVVARLLQDRGFADPVVLALPRGGVPVAMEAKRRIAAPLDLVFVRKIGVPGEPELAAAAVVNGERPDVVRNEEIVRRLGVTDAYIAAAAERELGEIARRRSLYLAGRPRVPLTGRTAVVVDDGLATGTTMRAVLKALKRQGARAIVLAVPVAPPDVVDALRPLVDDLVCLVMPEPFRAIGQHYRDFHQLTDAEVRALLDGASAGETS